MRLAQWGIIVFTSLLKFIATSRSISCNDFDSDNLLPSREVDDRVYVSAPIHNGLFARRFDHEGLFRRTPLSPDEVQKRIADLIGEIQSMERGKLPLAMKTQLKVSDYSPQLATEHLPKFHAVNEATLAEHKSQIKELQQARRTHEARRYLEALTAWTTVFSCNFAADAVHARCNSFIATLGRLQRKKTSRFKDEGRPRPKGRILRLKLTPPKTGLRILTDGGSNNGVKGRGGTAARVDSGNGKGESAGSRNSRDRKARMKYNERSEGESRGNNLAEVTTPSTSRKSSEDQQQPG